jgi:S-adenosylmethionine decarboxylase
MKVSLGDHILVDLHGASNLDDAEFVESVMEKCAAAAGASILTRNTHVFSPQNGISSTFVLMESHISIHTWPELGKAAFDAFMCGLARPRLCVPVLKEAFRPADVYITVLTRCQDRIERRTKSHSLGC